VARTGEHRIGTCRHERGDVFGESVAGHSDDRGEDTVLTEDLGRLDTVQH
jgi:hypothetical protein